MWYFLLILSYLTAATSKSISAERGGQFARSPKLDLPGYGPVVGNQETSIAGNTYYSFKGLPYSKAGRFEDFLAPEPWEDPLYATDFGPHCLDPVATPGGAEDCLYINVYTSNVDELGNPGEAPAPVLVMVHGGGFLYGDGRYNPVYFMDSKIVVAVLNYRLGPFGFVHSPDPSANLTGNYGLKDQIQALRWVQSTISAFGGDPNNVTLFGMSAGAASVHYLMLAKDETEGLFSKAITMSGNALCPWALQKNPGEKLVRLGKAVGCLDEGATEMDNAAYECLREMDAETLTTSWASAFQLWGGQPFTFVPSVDGLLIKDEPLTLLEAGKFLQIPWLGNDAKDEGILLVGDSIRSTEAMKYLSDNWLTMCPEIMEMGALSPDDAARACIQVKEHYLGSRPISYNTFYQYLRMIGDRLFDVPQQRSATIHSKFAPFYGYRYDYQSPTRSYLAGAYDGVTEDVPRMQSLVIHTDDFVQLIKDHRPPIVPGDPDDFVHQFLLGAYLSFINTGVPSIPPNLNYDLEWPRFTPEEPVFQVVDIHPRTDSYYAQPSDVEFWASLGL